MAIPDISCDMLNHGSELDSMMPVPSRQGRPPAKVVSVCVGSGIDSATADPCLLGLVHICYAEGPRG